MDALVRVETGFLRETFEAQVALERSFPSVSAHVHLEVRLTTESRVAHLRTTTALLYNLAFTAGGFRDPNDPTYYYINIIQEFINSTVLIQGVLIGCLRQNAASHTYRLPRRYSTTPQSPLGFSETAMNRLKFFTNITGVYQLECIYLRSYISI